MTADELKKIYKRMCFVIPGMIFFIIGDYCMGIEPDDSTIVSGMISTGWLTISDLRIGISNIGGMIGTAFYTAAALPFVRFLNYKLTQTDNVLEKRILMIYISGLIFGCMVFMYFHLACGTLIHNYNVIFEAASGNVETAVNQWNRSYSVQAVTYWASFIVLGVASSGGWIAVVLKKILPLKKVWILAAPLLVAGIGFMIEMIFPFSFNGFSSGFESFGWIVMFLGGMKAVKKEYDGSL